MGSKRAGSSELLDSLGQNIKKQRTGLRALDNILALSLQDLSKLPPDTLISHLVSLQQAYKDILDQLAQAERNLELEASSKSTTTGTTMNTEQVQAKADKLAKMMGSEIKKQMKRQPSCKAGGKRWTYSAMVPIAEVFFKSFNLEEGKKAWKQRKISLEMFEDITGELRASICYGHLGITSKEININWKREELSFSVSGLYGLA